MKSMSIYWPLADVKKAKRSARIVRETRTVTRFLGLGAAARELGVSRGHLSYVLHGQRVAGKALARGLARMGVKPDRKGAV
jgi:hypothetical protein